MSYRLLQFNLGTGLAQGYVLQGEGEHEGTNVSLSAHEMDDVIAAAQREARLRSDYSQTVVSLVKGDSRASPQEKAALASLLDRRFLLAHAARAQIRSIPLPIDGAYPNV